ncbi:exosome complex component CSL4 isoform X2 [Myotis daubentonii]|uniref:exosome complex component CSL4 isoform X2 n=1 Tax=Myotis daubentonii TaxID=98922 RepID=UPI002873C2A7|nr:exosome complex component CSL4 isoform X2 [Myotis daubentonii]
MEPAASAHGHPFQLRDPGPRGSTQPTMPRCLQSHPADPDPPPAHAQPRAQAHVQSFWSSAPGFARGNLGHVVYPFRKAPRGHVTNAPIGAFLIEALHRVLANERPFSFSSGLCIVAVMAPPVRYCIPGERLCNLEEGSPGSGTYTRHGYIFSSLAGCMTKSCENGATLSRLDSKIHESRPHHHTFRAQHKVNAQSTFVECTSSRAEHSVNSGSDTQSLKAQLKDRSD